MGFVRRDSKLFYLDFKLIMHKKIVRNIQKGKSRFKLFQDKSVKRFQQNASRLEHSNVRGKNKDKKG